MTIQSKIAGTLVVAGMLMGAAYADSSFVAEGDVWFTPHTSDNSSARVNYSLSPDTKVDDSAFVVEGESWFQPYDEDYAPRTNFSIGSMTEKTDDSAFVVEGESWFQPYDEDYAPRTNYSIGSVDVARTIDAQEHWYDDGAQ